MDPNRVYRSGLRVTALVSLLVSSGALAEARGVPRLEALFLEVRDLPPGWEIVAEAPEDVASDPDLRRAGVRERRATHYTRARGRRSEACSVELWSFADDARAERAQHMLPQDVARVQRIGPILLSLRCNTLVRERGSSELVSHECAAIADEIAARTRREVRSATP
jgi:hypothetical protein